MSPKDSLEQAESVQHDENATSDAVANVGLLVNQEQHDETVLHALIHRPWTTLWIAYAIFVMLITSFDNGAGSTVISIPRFRQDYGSPYAGNFVLPSKWQSAYSGGPTAATVLAAFAAGYISDKIGRKLTYLICFVIVFVGITLETVSHGSNAIFFGGKFICGLAIGGFLSNSMTYIAEVSPLALRGIATAASAVALALGPFIVSLLQNAYGTLESEWAYKSIFVAQYGITAVALLIWPFMPESSTWLVSHDKEEQGLRTLKRFGQDANEAGRTVSNIKWTLEMASRETEGASYLECFRKSNLRRTVVAIAPLSIQAFSGILFAAYTTYYTELAGYSIEESYRINIGGQVLAMGGNITSWFLIDRVGRRDLTFWGVVLITIVLTITGGLGTVPERSYIQGTVALLLMYAFLYNATIGATAYTALSEIATSRLRAKTTSLGLMLQSALFTMWAFVLPYIFNPDKANLGAKTAFIFAGTSMICCVYLWFCHPETAGRSLEELDEMFIKRIPARKFKAYITEAEQSGAEIKKQKDQEESRS
ncbi:general substrate transporter [Aspergillus stella-maris]|uniref:general substrate transporter n=1 Tax=Aspergillus stella-maris TaxID=1810926 RepID=UPI003CCD87DD